MNLAKQQDEKLISRNERNYCVSTMKYQKQKSGKKSHLIYQQEKEVPRTKPNQEGKRLVLRKLHNAEERK